MEGEEKASRRILFRVESWCVQGWLGCQERSALGLLAGGGAALRWLMVLFPDVVEYCTSLPILIIDVAEGLRIWLVRLKIEELCVQ